MAHYSKICNGDKRGAWSVNYDVHIMEYYTAIEMNEVTFVWKAWQVITFKQKGKYS